MGEREGVKQVCWTLPGCTGACLCPNLLLYQCYPAYPAALRIIYIIFYSKTIGEFIVSSRIERDVKYIKYVGIQYLWKCKIKCRKKKNIVILASELTFSFLELKLVTFFRIEQAYLTIACTVQLKIDYIHNLYA